MMQERERKESLQDDQEQRREVKTYHTRQGGPLWAAWAFHPWQEGGGKSMRTQTQPAGRQM